MSARKAVKVMRTQTVIRRDEGVEGDEGDEGAKGGNCGEKPANWRE